MISIVHPAESFEPTDVEEYIFSQSKKNPELEARVLEQISRQNEEVDW